MNAADAALLRALIELPEKTPKQWRKLDKLIRKAMRAHYRFWSSPEGTRRLIAEEAEIEADDADAWALEQADRAEASLRLLSSRERKRAREWVVSERSPWGTDELNPAPDSLTITKRIEARRKAKRR